MIRDVSTLDGYEFGQEDSKKLGPALFGVLCSLTGGEANAIVRSFNANMGARCGYRACYALNVRYNPKTPARMLQLLTQVVSPAQVKNIRELTMAIKKWIARKAMLATDLVNTYRPSCQQQS